MQFHCNSSQCYSSLCHCHRYHTELFVAFAVLIESSLSYAAPRCAMPYHRCALLRQAVAERSIALPLPVCSLRCYSNPRFAFALRPLLLFAIAGLLQSSLCPCTALPCLAFPLRFHSLHLFTFAARPKSLLSHRIPIRLIALAARSAHMHIFAVAFQFSAHLRHCVASQCRSIHAFPLRCLLYCLLLSLVFIACFFFCLFLSRSSPYRINV